MLCGTDGFSAHHLEDHSVLLPLTGPEHHSIIGSHKIHRLQHLCKHTIKNNNKQQHQNTLSTLKQAAASLMSWSVWVVGFQPVWCRRFLPFSTLWHWAILMSISSWNRQLSGNSTLSQVWRVFQTYCCGKRLHPHLTVNHISPVVQSQQPHGQSPHPDHRSQGGDVAEPQPARCHHGGSVVLWAARRTRQSCWQHGTLTINCVSFVSPRWASFS